jgi:hypothetical protein
MSSEESIQGIANLMDLSRTLVLLTLGKRSHASWTNLNNTVKEPHYAWYPRAAITAATSGARPPCKTVRIG